MKRQRAIESDASDRDLANAWRTHAPAAMRFATTLVGPADAPDVTASAFLRVTRQPGWTEFERFDHYLLRSVRNEAKNLHRERRRRWERDLTAVRPEASSDPMPDIDLLRAVAALSVNQRSVVFLAYWNDMTESEIANTLGISRGTVHRSIDRARVALRKALK